MPTDKKRINITVDDSLYEVLESLRVAKNMQSLSALVLILTQKALEFDEDHYLLGLIKQRTDEHSISHEELWG